MISETFNRDCVEAMKEYPDNYFDLAVVDPPYGIGFSDYERGSMGLKVKERYTKSGKKQWDTEIPSGKYFEELFRVSKNQIIWGGNYFDLPPTQCFIFWYKQNPVPNFADGELAWTSFKKPASCFDYRYYGNLDGNTSASDKIHPTQKPIALYDWIFTNYAKQGMKILDTHLGSQSSRIAAYKAGLNFTGFELDKDYFEQGNQRFNDFLTVYNQEVGKEKSLKGQARLF
jgi:site-specific DNA-methyltransferase (adenine-specific)